MQPIAFVNGTFMPLAEARVPIEDRGYQFADGVYEVVVARGGKCFCLDEHLERLRHSLTGIELPLDLAPLRLPELIDEGIRRCGYPDVMVYLQITRGMASRDHVFPKAADPTLVMTFKALPKYDPALRARGVALMTQRDIRWAKCDIKSISLLPAVLMKNRAKQAGYYDTVILAEDDTVREASAANIFIITGGAVKTPPRSEKILHGITRNYLVAHAADWGVPCEEVDFKLKDLLAADEAFITSSTMNVMPVTSIDGQAIGDGQVGPVTRRLAAGLDAAG